MIYFITGSSGVGKSTLVQELKALLPEHVVVHDFDELGVPLDADGQWRVATTHKWIALAKENASKSIATIIVGLTHPNEVQDVAKEARVEVAYCMLEVELEELRWRLMAHRFSSVERIANLKKYEGVTPEQFFENNEKHVAQIRQEAERLGAFFLDTTHVSPRQTAEAVCSWVRGSNPNS